MGGPIGIFKSHITPIDRLVKTTVGRRDMLDDLLEKLRKNAGKKGGQHYLFIGPRGIGKTHFLSLVENAVEKNDRLAQLFTLIRFPEENNRILSFADILLEIIRSLGEADANGEWKGAHASLSTTENDQEIIDTVVPRLKKYHKKTGKTLLLLMENLDSLLSQQIKNEQDIHRFRTFLMDSPCATLIATSPVYFPGITSEQRPLYDFFDIQILEDLSEDFTLELVRRNLELEDRRDLLENLDKLVPKIKALHIMTGGNPRLIMMLYELIAHESILDVKFQFQKLLDQVTPFYQDRLKDLAPQERALLETMALVRTEPRTPALLAARMRKPQKQISSLLKRMMKAGYLTVSENPHDRRSRIYRIKEGFFDLWLAMSESCTHRKRLGYLVNFFEAYFLDRMEREKKRKELWERIETDTKERPKRQNELEFLGYLSEVGDDTERFGAKMELSLHSLKDGDALKARELLAEIKPLAANCGIFTWMTEQTQRWSEGEPGLDVSRWLEELIEYWKIQRSGNLEKVVDIAQRLGMDLSDKGLHKIRIELLQDALQYAGKPHDKVLIHTQIAQSAKMDGQLAYALQALKSALKLCVEIGDKAGEGTTLNNISALYHAQGDYETALTYLKQSLAIMQQIGNKAGLCITLFNIGHIHARNSQIQKALNAWITVYRTAKRLNLTQLLKDLVDLAPKLGFNEGLKSWEKLAQQIKKRRDS